MTRPAASRVKVESTTTGTGTFTLGSPPSGEHVQAFPSALNGQLLSYAIDHVTANEYENGLGVYTHSGTTLSRLYVEESSNSDALVNFSSGTKIVRIVSLALDVAPNIATTDPTTTNDRTEGYKRGSRWLNTTTGRWWICRDDTTDAAVWDQMVIAAEFDALEVLPATTVTGTTNTIAADTVRTYRRYTNSGTITVTVDEVADDFEGVLIKDDSGATLNLVAAGSPGVVTFNGAETYAVGNIALVKREGSATDLVVTEIPSTSNFLALSGGFGSGGIAGFGREVTTRGEGSPADPILITDSGRWIIVDGPVEIPNDPIGTGAHESWFGCTLEFNGDFDITFNGAVWDTGSADGDIVDVQVLSASTIRITPILLAADVITQADFA